MTLSKLVSAQMATDFDSSPVVHTTHGRVRGVKLTALYGEQFYSFDGIPYGQPPLGELRFKEPKDVEPWEGILDCTEPKDKCLQVASISKQVEGSEDCLYLNIAVKNLSSGKPLPVMVYIHGGTFRNGDPTRRALGPDYLMREQVVYISIGYRVGAFGFLSFADPSLDIPGNAALKDVVLALKWIRANVGSFNGDPGNITLFGHSSGSCMVHMLMVSPQAEGLFQKAILLGGFFPETCSRPGVEFEFAKHLGYEGENNDREVFNYINSVDPKLLTELDFRPLYERLQNAGYPPFLPRVEPYTTPSTILLDEPRVLHRNAWSNRIPIMMGCTSNEGLLGPMVNMRNDPLLVNAVKNRMEFLLPRTLLRHADPCTCRILGHRLLKKFTGVYCHDVSAEHFFAISDIFTYNLLHYQQRMIKARLEYSQADNYVYRFDFDSPDFNFYRIRYHGTDIRGVMHADELGYLFKLPATFKLDKTRPEYVAICRFVALFTEFARSSNPNGPQTKSLVDWKPVSRKEPIMVLNISEELKFVPQPERKKLNFHDQLYRNAGLELI